MRFVATVFLWLVTTVALAVAVPTAWAQKNVVDENGYSAFATSAAKDPQLQQAMAAELGSQLKKLVEGTGYDVSTDLLQGVAAARTPPSSVFPGQFAQANRIVHRWMFTDSPSSRPTSLGVGRSTCRRCCRDAVRSGRRLSSSASKRRQRWKCR